MSKSKNYKKIYPVKLFTMFNSSYLTWNFYFTGIIFTLIILFSVFGVVESSEAAIIFTDGKWESTFDCAEQTVITSINCNDMDVYLEQNEDNSSDFTQNSKIEAAANNSFGTGNGFSRINGWGDRGFGGGISDNSSSIYAGFPTPEKELWIRMYIRYPSNWKADPFIADKYIFLNQADGIMDTIIEPSGLGFRILIQGRTEETLITGVGKNAQSTFKVSDMFTTGTYVGDDTWHCVETHLKMDTNGTLTGAGNGVGQVWVDGVLIIDTTTINYSHGNATAKTGWSDSTFNLNQNKLVAVDANLARVFIDDIVIYNTTPPNIDSEGNSYIGPIESSDTTPPAHPTGLSVE